MSLTAQVQQLVDQVTANTNAAVAAEQALTFQGTKIDELNAKIATLSAASGALSTDDLTALTQMGQQLSLTNTALIKAVPANTGDNAPATVSGGIVGAAPVVVGGQPVSGGTPVNVDHITGAPVIGGDPVPADPISGAPVVAPVANVVADPAAAPAADPAAAPAADTPKT